MDLNKSVILKKRAINILNQKTKICIVILSFISTLKYSAKAADTDSSSSICFAFLNNTEGSSVIQFPLARGILLGLLGENHRPELTNWSALNKGSLAEYLAAKLPEARDHTMSLRFAANPQWDNKREFSPLSLDIRFGLIEALDQSNGPPIMISSGFAQRYLLQNFPGPIRFRNQPRGLNELIVIDQMLADEFVTQAIGDQPMFGNLFSRQDLISFQISPDNLSAISEVKPTLTEEDPSITSLKERFKQGTQLKFITQVLSDTQKSTAFLSQYGRADVITDYGGAATTENDLGAVMAQYNLLLKDGGFLFLAIPIKKVARNQNTTFTHFSHRVGKALKPVAPDMFFSKIPGFKLINSYVFTGELFNDPVSRSVHFAMNYSGVENYNGNFETAILILKKSGNGASEQINSIVSTVLETTNRRHFILDRLTLVKP
jgi:hypothetical protein